MVQCHCVVIGSFTFVTLITAMNKSPKDTLESDSLLTNDDTHDCLHPPDSLDVYSVSKEFKPLLILAIPVIVSLMLTISIEIVSLAYVGNYLTAAEFAATGLAFSFCNVFGVSIGEGISTACETICSQAYGADNKCLMGVTLTRGILIGCLGLLISSAIWLNTESLLLLCGQDPIVSKMAGRYLLIALPVLPAAFLFSLLEKYLQAQSVVLPIVYVDIFTNIINVLANYIFVVYLELGLDGSAIVFSIISWMHVILICFYIWKYGDRDALPRFSPPPITSIMIYMSLNPTITHLSVIFFTHAHSAQLPFCFCLFSFFSFFRWSRKSLTGWGSYCNIALPGKNANHLILTQTLSPITPNS